MLRKEHLAATTAAFAQLPFKKAARQLAAAAERNGVVHNGETNLSNLVLADRWDLDAMEEELKWLAVGPDDDLLAIRARTLLPMLERARRKRANKVRHRDT